MTYKNIYTHPTTLIGMAGGLVFFCADKAWQLNKILYLNSYSRMVSINQNLGSPRIIIIIIRLTCQFHLKWVARKTENGSGSHAWGFKSVLSDVDI